MTLGHVYDMDLRRNENIIKEVIIQAQGEVRTVHLIQRFLYSTSTVYKDGS